MVKKAEPQQIEPGTKLERRQATRVGKELGTAIRNISVRRKGTLLVHDSLQSTIGVFLSLLGWNVAYEVPFEVGTWGSDRMVFDVVGSRGKKTVVVEVKDAVAARDLGQVFGYGIALKLAKEKAKLYLGTDILNYGELTQGVVGEAVHQLMEHYDLGVILADKYLLMVADNYAQLVLDEMPALIPSEEPVG